MLACLNEKKKFYCCFDSPENSVNGYSYIHITFPNEFVLISFNRIFIE